MEALQGAARRLFSLRRASADDYELLPSSTSNTPDLESPHHTHNGGRPGRRSSFSPLSTQLLGASSRCSCCVACLHHLTLRRVLLIIACIPLLLAAGVLVSGVPPSYSHIRKYERALPQHDLSLPSPEGRDGKYVRFPNHIWGHGLNNILQEIIFMSQLAFLSNRSYVFEDYTWSHTPLPYTIYDFALRPARVPLNAFISGPSAGGPMPIVDGAHAPRAVSAEWWETVCPPERRVVVPSHDAPVDAEGEVVMSWWVARLKREEAGCLEVENSPPVFDQFLFGSSRVLSAWPALSQSPIVRNFTWSPLVQAGVIENVELLLPPSSSPPSTTTSPLPILFPPATASAYALPSSSASLRSSSTSLTTPTASTSPPTTSSSPIPYIPGLVALHLRRGDYVRHCPRLVRWGATYMGFNQFPELPDRFEPPPFKTFNGREQYYMEHCWPSVEQIVEKLRVVRREWEEDWEAGRRQGSKRALTHVYVLTNGWPWWVNSLRDALRADGWSSLASSLDLEARLDSEQTYVAMAVDMAIAERAEVFVGNGFSSLTSNVVVLRMAKGLHPKSNRFW